MSNTREELYVTVKIKVSEYFEDFDSEWCIDGPSKVQVVDTNMDEGQCDSMMEMLGQSDFYTLGFPYGIGRAIEYPGTEIEFNRRY